MSKPKMTLEEARAFEIEMTQKLATVIRQFEDTTGCVVKEIVMERAQLIGKASPELVGLTIETLLS